MVIDIGIHRVRKAAIIDVPSATTTTDAMDKYRLNQPEAPTVLQYLATCGKHGIILSLVRKDTTL